MPPALTRENALARLVEENAPEVLTAAAEQSLALQMFQRINIGTNQTKFTFLDTLPKAQWLVPNTDEMQAKPSIGEIGYDSVTVGVEEIAGTAYIAENVLDDLQFDAWAEVRRTVAEAIGQVIDSTVFFGVSPYGDAVPASFPEGGIVGQTIEKGANVDYSATDFFTSLNAAMALIEESGFEPRTLFAGRSTAPLLRNLRDDNGQFLYATDARSAQPVSTVWGIPLTFVNRRVWDSALASVLLGDLSTTRIVMRQDLQVKVLTEATIQGVNLAEKDAIGMRFKMRLGWTILPNPTRFAGAVNDWPYAIVEGTTPTP